MNIARRSIDSALITWLLILFCLGGGIWGYATMGRLEDPAFTLKQAVVTTQYPGASAAEVAREVSEPLETAIQQMAEVDEVTSSNKPGLSRISVTIDTTVNGKDLPQVWDKLRNRASDAAGDLPDGAMAPQVNDGFGDVYGLYFAITAPGFSDAEIHEIANYLRRDLLTVDGVSDVTLGGLPEEAIYVVPDMAILANLGISPDAIIGQLRSAASVTRSGATSTGDMRLRLDMPSGTDSVEALAELTVSAGDRILRLVDIAEVHRTRDETPQQVIRHNGEEAFTIAVAGTSDENIVEIGTRVDARLAQLAETLPEGVDLHPIYRQHVVVDKASSAFIVNLVASVVIVVVVLAVFMGWRAAVVVGATLLLTVVGTLFFMAIFGLEMERISLGALIIAMGMLVDNAIVVAEGMQLKMLAGRTSREAADEASLRVQTPLLGATVIGIMAFAGIGLSPDSTGEFLFSLFAVIGISLLLSWLLALTVTPLLAHYVFKRDTRGDGDQYGGALFRAYGKALRGAIRARWVVLPSLVVLTAACFWSFTKVENQFFPDSDAPLLYVHYKLPQGSSIDAVQTDLEQVEDWLLAREEVTDVSTFAGGGAARFMLTYSPEEGMPSYGHVIIRTAEMEQIAALRQELEAFAQAAMLTGEFRTQQLAFGPNSGAAVEVRISGQDPVVLRQLAEQVEGIMVSDGTLLSNPRADWREWEPVIVPLYATERSQNAGVLRTDLSEALLMATDGVTVTEYREGDRQIPVVLLSREPGAPSRIEDQIVWSDASGDYVPVAQLVDGFEIDRQNSLIQRRNRVPTITVEADLAPGATATEARDQIVAAVEALEMPLGYEMIWGGEFENSAKARGNLAKQLPLSFLTMVLISILLFGRLRQPLIIWLLVPMAVNGAVIGLLVTGLPFSFTALLGLLSLSGMLIKNGIVLIEEIDLVRAEGVPFDRAVEQASTSRLRPVGLAAATTILGMAPLLTDSFFASMSVTIMGGLAFATVLTLIAAPVLYVVLFASERRRDGVDDPHPTGHLGSAARS
ncbi:efflux RND transporter permease subunit [Pseudooceanicola sp. LIPI14-2-Ac024]|uniref:efflux RND transporter permease subunit n=1 Tax=Pseudooceanicola sp. LIPI14-2-Ac024 TaxID=3344875 RepID=UPI0035CFA0FD